MISDKRMFLTEDETAAVPAGDERANSLLVGQGCFLPDHVARRYGLLNDGNTDDGSADDSQTEDKAITKPPGTKAVRGPRARN